VFPTMQLGLIFCIRCFFLLLMHSWFCRTSL